MRKVIVHIDLNAFFVRCEEIRDPSLIDKPVAIGHVGRAGIVSTCSYKAREYGVHSGMPMFQATKLCPNLIIKPDDFDLYFKFSNQFIKFVKEITPIVEVASIDECYADFTEVVKGVKDITKFFRDIQRDLYNKTKLKCSIGVGPTKFLAKMGSDYKKPLGLTIIRKRDIKNILYPLPIENMMWCGKKSQPRLKAIGINTIGDLMEKIELNDDKINEVIGNFRFAAKEMLSGESDDVVNTEPWDPKSQGHSSTFPEDTNNFNEIKEMLSKIAHWVSDALVRERKLANTIQIVAKEFDFKMHNKSVTLSSPTNSYQKIFDTATRLYEKNFLNLTVRLVGITAQKLIPIEEMAIQMSFFDYEMHEEENKTKLLINELNGKLSSPALKRASEVRKKKKDEHNGFFR